MAFLKSVLNQLLLLECEFKKDDSLKMKIYYIYYCNFLNKFLKSTFLVSKRWKYIIMKEIDIPIIALSIKQLPFINIDKANGFKTLRYFRILDSPKTPPEYQSFKRFLHLFFKDFKYTENEFYKYIDTYILGISAFKEYEFSIFKISGNQGNHLIQELERLYSLIKCNRYLLNYNPVGGTLILKMDQYLTPDQHLKINELMVKLRIQGLRIEGLNPLATERTKYPLIFKSPYIRFVKSVVEDTCNRSKWFQYIFKSNPNLLFWAEYCQNNDSIFVESFCNHKNIETLHLSSATAEVKDFVKFLETNESLKIFSSETAFEGTTSKVMKKVNNTLESIRILHPTPELINVLGDNVKYLKKLKEIITVPLFYSDFDVYNPWSNLFKKMDKPFKFTFHDHYASVPMDPITKSSLLLAKQLAKLKGIKELENAHYTNTIIKSNSKMLLNFRTNEDFDINTMKSNNTIEKLIIHIDGFKSPDSCLKIINFSKTLKVLQLISKNISLLQKFKKTIESSPNTYQIKNSIIKSKKIRESIFHLQDNNDSKLTINIK